MSFAFLRKHDAEKLSSELRGDMIRTMKHRRIIIGLNSLAMASLAVVAAYQVGITRHVPEPALPRLDADKVDSSAEAYQQLSTPDAFIGVVSYAITMMLAAMDGSKRAQQHPFVPVGLTAKVAFDVLGAGKLAIDQWTKHKAFCAWCLWHRQRRSLQCHFFLPRQRKPFIP